MTGFALLKEVDSVLEGFPLNQFYLVMHVAGTEPSGGGQFFRDFDIGNSRLKMKLEIYLSLALLLLLFAYIVFRVIVKRDYRDHGQLSVFGSALQLLVFCGFFSFPYLYNSPEWSWFWKQNNSVAPIFHILGLRLICSGFLIAFGTMAWFGIGKAFGVNVKSLTRNGPYKKSRNPQILGGYLLVIGAFTQWPSLYGVGWILIYAIISHWMIISEEEYLSRFFGKDYENYCSEVPRYLFVPKRKKESSP